MLWYEQTAEVTPKKKKKKHRQTEEETTESSAVEVSITGVLGCSTVCSKVPEVTTPKKKKKKEKTEC